MPEQTGPNLEQVSEILTEIYQTLGQNIYVPNLEGSPPINGLRMQVHLVVGSFARVFHDLDRDGQLWEATIDNPRDLWLNTARLRDAMYEPGKGTWYNARIIVEVEDGKLHGTADFDYDHEPPFAEALGSVNALSFWCDAKVYPRDPEHTPSWLAERVAQAEEIIRTQHVPDDLLAPYVNDRQAWIKRMHAESDPR